ncbi:MAG TPA: aminotransferase class III-fold pyridoxal phosphate-dependent enzyme [Steroidobacteraceae bacterium]|nr:aminotransferase class III-fold pyridoxal phosphate-dependent enzyme [Steroidobacteraceae bacterium]
MNAHASSLETSHAAHDPLAPVFAQYPLPVVRGEGVWLYTADGRRVLDLYGGHAVAALGYGHPAWTKALAEQARTMNFQSNAVPMDVRTRAANKLIAFSKLPVQSVFLVNSGAEANENALKMAFTMNAGRTEVVALEQSFHGRTAAAGALTWGAAKKWYGFPRTPFDVKFIARRDIAALAQITEKTAAVLVEPIQGVGGAFDLGADYLKALRKRCDETGTVLIFDEVQCGFGRCGEPFAANLYGVLPDMITTAKALGNGFPCSALLMMKKAADAVKMDALGTTFGGGPMADAAIEATIEAIESDDLLANVRRVSAYIRKTCIVGPVTGHQGAGFLTGLICKVPAAPLQKALMNEHNILAGTSGDPNVLRLLPPFILKEAEVDLLAAALKKLG